MIGVRAWPFWVFVALLVVLHFTLHLALGFAAVAPDLLVVAVLLAVRRMRAGAAAAFGLAAGLLQDGLSLIAFGAEAVTLTVLGYLGARSRDFFVGDSLLFVGLYLFTGKWAHDMIHSLLTGAGGGDFFLRLLVLAPLVGLYAAAAGMIALGIYRSITGER